MQFEILMNVNSIRANIHRMEQEAVLLFTHALVSNSELYAEQESTMLFFKPLLASYYLLF